MSGTFSLWVYIVEEFLTSKAINHGYRKNITSESYIEMPSSTVCRVSALMQNLRECNQCLSEFNKRDELNNLILLVHLSYQRENA